MNTDSIRLKLSEVESNILTLPPLILLDKLEVLDSTVFKHRAELYLKYLRLVMYIHNKIGKTDIAGEYAKQILLHKDIEFYKEEKGYAKLIQGKISLSKRDFENAYPLIHSALDVFSKVNNKELECAAIIDLGRVQYALSNFETALVHFLHAEKLSDEFSLTPVIKAPILNHLGLVQTELQNLDEAEYYFKLALSTQNSPTNLLNEAGLLINLSNVYKRKAQYTQQIETLYKAQTLYKQIGNQELYFVSNLSLISAYLDQKLQKKALETLKSCELLFSEVKQPKSIAEYYFLQARYLLAHPPSKQKKSSIIRFLKQALELCKEHNIVLLELAATELLVDFYSEQKDWQNLSQCLIRKGDIEKDILNDAKQKHIISMEFKFRTQIKEKENQILFAQKKAVEQERDHLQTQLIMKTNSMLEQLKAVNQLRTEILDTLKDLDTAESILGKVKRKLNSSSVLRQDWNSFSEVFNQVHPSFINKLLDTTPSLTKMEIRICVLLRTGMASEDIAQLLSLSERSIENHRLRIRKKLNLKRNDNIYAVLSQL